MIRFSKPAVIAALALLGLHLIAAALGLPKLLINLFILAAPVAGAAACLWRSGHGSALLVDKWRLLALGMLVWASGQAWYVYALTMKTTLGPTALPSDFWFLTYAIFVMLAVSSVGEGQDSTAILVADSAQALLAIVLIYITLFMQAHGDRAPIPPSQITMLYLMENLALSITATLRLLAMPKGENRFFHRTACTFAWLMLLVSTPLNYIEVFVKSTEGRPIEAAWQLPFLAVFVLALSRDKRATTLEVEKTRTLGAMIVYNASPVFFTICVLLLGARLAQLRPKMGFGAVVAALLIYTFRASILQTRLRQVQDELNASERQLKQMNSRLHEQSLHDVLTGVANRRHFEQTLEVEWNRAMRSGWPLSLVMLDVDHFKALNDRYGHQRGDECLTTVAQMLRHDLRRGGEFLARYGGEEFVAVLPNVDAEGALLTAEAMRARVQELRIENHGSPLGELTISAGVCSVVPLRGMTRERMLAAADAALYRAKAAGRNRVEPAEPLRAVGDSGALHTSIPLLGRLSE